MRSLLFNSVEDSNFCYLKPKSKMFKKAAIKELMRIIRESDKTVVYKGVIVSDLKEIAKKYDNKLEVYIDLLDKVLVLQSNEKYELPNPMNYNSYIDGLMPYINMCNLYLDKFSNYTKCYTSNPIQMTPSFKHFYTLLNNSLSKDRYEREVLGDPRTSMKLDKLLEDYINFNQVTNKATW